MPLALLANTAATGVLIGLILTVQLVHYPLFAAVGRAEWPAYAAAHARRITPLVAPWMALELATSLWLAAAPPPGVPRAPAWAAAGATLLTWGVTLLVNGPAFARLARAWDDGLHRRVVRANWLRVALWTGRGALLLFLLGQAR